MSDALQAALAARLGAQYEIEGLLGQGGMGSVFRARDTTLDRAVAIKVISGDLATNPELKDRFLLEARTVAKLRHPNIVAVYTAGEADGLLYFVMELVPGESLRDLMAREGKVAPQRTERILHELAMALDYAHSNGIVHRDVKPENILLDRETGRAMLTDFGVARALESSGNITGTGMILGSPRYMSPEQASGESTLDGRSDLYALALVGYEMLTGIPVVESGNVAGMLVKHLTEKPKPVAEAMPQAPEGLALALDRALEKDREHRWRNGREMAEVIGMAWTPTPGSGVHAGVAARMQRRSNLAFVLGAVVVVAGLLVGMGLKWLGARGGGDPRKSYAVVPFEIQSGNSEVQWLRDGAVNMLTLALSHWNDLSVVPYERTLNLVKDVGAAERRVSLDEAQTVARRGGAGTLVMGQVSTTRDSLIVVARLYDVRSGDPVNTVTRAAALGDDPRPLFDDLARYLLDVAGGSSSASVDVARATTASITAYRAYLDGVRLLNSWRLTEADSALSAAIAADSTFALAWHKRALALGWGGGGVEYIASAQRAVELADRLPPRQQALVRGHLALARGLFASDGGLGASTASLREAQRIYSELLAQDSLAAEGWYGLADAYFHDTPTTVDSLPAYQTRFNLALRAFHRTLEIDSTFHLAYQHLVQQYQQVSSPSFGGVLDGDSVVIPTTPDAAQRLTRVRSLEARRRDAEQRGLAIANGWMRADPDAPAAYLAVANGYVTSGRPDSAVAIIDRALTRPALATPGMQLQSILYYLFADEPVRAFARAEETLRAPVPTLRRAPVSERIVGFAVALGAAASVGNAAALDAYLERFVAVDSVFPYSNVPTRDVMEWYVTSLRTAVSGEISPAQRRYLLEGLRRVSGSADPVMAQAAAMSASVPLGAYLLTRDTVFSNAFRRLPNVGTSHTDLEALEALARGDTATARRIAESYTHPDSMANARFSFVGLRTMARAEVLAAVGNRTWAIAYLEALDPARYNSIGLGEPGFAFYTRSFLTRAALYEADGQPQKAIAALEEFLRRTEAGDEAIAPARREARAALARLRDR